MTMQQNNRKYPRYKIQVFLRMDWNQGLTVPLKIPAKSKLITSQEKEKKTSQFIKL